jgi:hypothetical protein
MKTLGSDAENRANEINGSRRQKTGHRNKIKDVAAGSDKLNRNFSRCPSQI